MFQSFDVLKNKICHNTSVAKEAISRIVIIFPILLIFWVAIIFLGIKYCLVRKRQSPI